MKNDRLRTKGGLGFSAIVGLRGDLDADIQFNRKAFNDTLITFKKEYPVIDSYINKAADFIKDIQRKTKPVWSW